MEQYIQIPRRRWWLIIIALFLPIFIVQFAQAKEPEQEAYTWLNWVDYISYHPDYRQHQEPQDIATKGCQWGTWVTFPNKIEAIAAKVKNWDKPTALFQSLDFVAIYKHPDHYYKHCLEYLADPKHPEERKKIVIYAMEQCGSWLAEACHKLYQKQQLSAELFRLALGDFDLLHIHSLVTQDGYSEFDKKRVIDFLQQLQNEVGAQTLIGIHIEAVLSGRVAKKWAGKASKPLLHYRDKLPIASTIQQAAKEYHKYMEHRQWLNTGHWEELSEEELVAERGQQHYLMLLEHINEYILPPDMCEDPYFAFLESPQTTPDEKRLFLFAMYRLESLSAAKLLRRAHWAYRTGKLALPLLEELLYSSIPLDMGEVDYPCYPFFVTSYKGTSDQGGLDRLIALPTIPCGWKDLAKRLKKGTLLSKKEMKYLEGYQKFIATHFILYETIPAQK